MHPNGSTSLIMAWLLELSWQPWTIMPTLVGNKPLYPGVPTKGAAIQGSVSEKYQRMGIMGINYHLKPMLDTIVERKCLKTT